MSSYESGITVPGAGDTSPVGMFPAVGGFRVKKRSLVSQTSGTRLVSYNGGRGKGHPIVSREIKDNKELGKELGTELIFPSNRQMDGFLKTT